jgi:hypothetical protein
MNEPEPQPQAFEPSPPPKIGGTQLGYRMIDACWALMTAMMHEMMREPRDDVKCRELWYALEVCQNQAHTELQKDVGRLLKGADPETQQFLLDRMMAVLDDIDAEANTLYRAMIYVGVINGQIGRA